ncbi:MAG: aminodeoxychorismate/anthranilate synthase component II [Candidatus Zixiibacteriota bacterium]|nr:MAG: aminodeoxychorismate/anthranilate synthase component II [candidate division Zixibacteria bacterium]
MILMIDNYDSFTYNVVQYLGELGADLKVYRNDEITVDQAVSLNPEAIVLSPGPGRPEKAGIMEDLIRAAAGKLPILGICLGHQAIAQVYGAAIGYAPAIMHGKTSEVSHDGSTLFKEIESPFVATRYHSLVVEPGSLSSDFKTSAWTDDNVIMGIKHATLPLYGLQFHPESILTPRGKDMLHNFLKSI